MTGPGFPSSSQWNVSESHSDSVHRLVQALGISPIIAKLLVCRGISSEHAAREFLEPQLSHLHDPYRMLGMRVAVGRLQQALRNGEPILIYGDYDVDGTIATVLLKVAAERAAAALGVQSDIRYHIPHRIREGYGIQDSRIETAAAEGVRLIVSVDTGIRAFSAATEAKRFGLDLIVTDHHLPDDVRGIPEALAVLNPNQRGCGYPYKELCGAGVAYKLAQALLESSVPVAEEQTRLREKTLPSFLKLLSIATIADAVPLTGENRVIAHLGLRELRKPAQHGLRALMELAAIDLKRPLSAIDVGFRLAPRINAAGRMDVASDVVDMFLERDPAIARSLAEKLHSLNDDRRATEAEALRAIEQQLEEMNESPEGIPACVVLDDEAWHRGVIGILASRVVDRTGRPALVISHEEGQAYGSGRSIPGFHLLDALTSAHQACASGLLLRFGGHAHAVGFSLESSRVGELRANMLRIAAEETSGGNDAKGMECDAEVRFDELTGDLLDGLESIAPFGQGNPEPLLVTRGVHLVGQIRQIKERHLRLVFSDAKGSTRFGAMLWSRRTVWARTAVDEGWAAGDCFDIAYRMHKNWHPDFGGWELDIVAIERIATADKLLSAKVLRPLADG